MNNSTLDHSQPSRRINGHILVVGVELGSVDSQRIRDNPFDFLRGELRGGGTKGSCCRGDWEGKKKGKEKEGRREKQTFSLSLNGERAVKSIIGRGTETSLQTALAKGRIDTIDVSSQPVESTSLNIAISQKGSGVSLFYWKYLSEFGGKDFFKLEEIKQGNNKQRMKNLEEKVRDGSTRATANRNGRVSNSFQTIDITGLVKDNFSVVAK